MGNKQSLICRAVGTENGVTTVVASTDAVDRMSDVVSQDWDLRAFKDNPVIVWAHNYEAAPVGKATSVEVVEGRLMVQIQWDDEEDNPDGMRTARQFKDGFMNAVSVGFSPGATVQRSRLDIDNPNHGERGMVYGTQDSPNVLLEVSAVTLPANPEALAVRHASEDDPEDTAVEIRSEILKLIREDPQLRAELGAVASEWTQPLPTPLTWLSGEDT